MQPTAIIAAARLLWDAWQRGARIRELPADCRPATVDEGYAIQAVLETVSGQRLAGWKIAATSKAGQAHINVDGPLAGRLLAGRMFGSGASIPFGHNAMRVAEAEFAFRFDRDLTPRDTPYSVDEVLDAVGSLHPAIEVPDSRYEEFVSVGAAQLIADNACAHYFVLGDASPVPWREIDLVEYPAVLRVGPPKGGPHVQGDAGPHVRESLGKGANVLGDPRVALRWLVNEVCRLGIGVSEGQVVTTGTCVTPIPISPGDRVVADFGNFGGVELTLV